ncbi:MAG: hypothetical protein SVC26_06195 [Pseudomonadota bacterium]|nr:hypothetical protein [Pseudomonadota bacterium]
MMLHLAKQLLSRLIKHGAILLAGVLFMVMSVTVQAETSMSKVLAKQPDTTCKTGLIDAAERYIEFREHRLVAVGELDNEIVQVTGYQAYMDRDVQLMFAAVPVKLAAADASEPSDACQITVEQVFIVDTPCIAAREEVNRFKKWQFMGRLSPNTFVLKHPEKNIEQAYLTGVLSGGACQILTQEITQFLTPNTPSSAASDDSQL